jgi:hypothetical protein
LRRIKEIQKQITDFNNCKLKIYIKSIKLRSLETTGVCLEFLYKIYNLKHRSIYSKKEKLQDGEIFVERKVLYSALFINLVRWHTGDASLPLSDVILAQLAYPLSDVMFYLHSGITNLSLYKHWVGAANLVRTN